MRSRPFLIVCLAYADSCFGVELCSRLFFIDMIDLAIASLAKGIKIKNTCHSFLLIASVKSSFMRTTVLQWKTLLHKHGDQFLLCLQDRSYHLEH